MGLETMTLVSKRLESKKIKFVLGLEKTVWAFQDCFLTITCTI